MEMLKQVALTASMMDEARRREFVQKEEDEQEVKHRRTDSVYYGNRAMRRRAAHLTRLRAKAEA